MALEISGNIELAGGLTISSCYARTFYKVYEQSNEVKIGCSFYASKNAYDSGLGTINAYIAPPAYYPYNRDTDGVDILDFTQIKIKAELEALGYSVVITDI